MAFCSNCGNKLKDGAKFCSYCGERTSAPEPKEPPRATQSERKSEFAGTQIKCPACGSDIPSLTAICPSCGHEITTARGSDAVASFIAAIDDCDKRIAAQGPTTKKGGWSTWKAWKKIGWVLLNIYFFCIPLLIYYLRPYFRFNKTPVLSPEEKHKATIIENYTFPNDRGSILEALLFIKSKASFLSNEKANAYNSYWMRLWKQKAEQLHQQAELLFPGDRIANDAFTSIQNANGQMKKKMQIRVGITLGIILIALLCMMIRGCCSDSSSNNSYDSNATYDWPQNQYTEIIPKPSSETGKIVSERPEQLWFEVYNITEDQFEAYVKECREVGFVVDLVKSGTLFTAYNDDGYYLSVTHSGGSDKMTVIVKEPETVVSDTTEEEPDAEMVATTVVTDAEVVTTATEPEVPAVTQATEAPQVNVSAVYDTEINYYSNEYLEITDFGYHVSGEYIWCVVGITNIKNDVAIECPVYRVTAYDKDNKILGSEEQTLMILYPGQECVCAAVLIEVGEKPHRIDITALDPEEYFISSVTMLEHPAHEPMVGQNITVRNESVTGEIFNPNDYKVGSAMVTVIFRDDSGKIVYSAMTFINQIPANGSTPFEVNYYTDIKLPSNCEVYAYLW